MKKQIKRLRGMKHNPTRFFKVMFFLIRKSKALRVSATNKCLKGWYKNYPLALVLKINDDVNKIIDTKDTNFKFKRVYIRKGEND